MEEVVRYVIHLEDNFGNVKESKILRLFHHQGPFEIGSHMTYNDVRYVLRDMNTNLDKDLREQDELMTVKTELFYKPDPKEK